MTLTDSSTNGSTPATVEAEDGLAGPQPPASSTSFRRVVAAFAVVALVAVFVVAYAAGHNDPRRLAAATQRVTAPPTTEATRTTGGLSTTLPTAGTTFPTNELGMVEFFIEATVVPTVNGCTENLDYRWTFDPAKTPPDGTDVVIAFDDPVGPSTSHYSAFNGGLHVNIAVNLQVGQGTWSANVVSVGAQAAAPRPLSVEITGTC